jgi:pimeloyl-ACP methyl ester carboxylesterase
MHLRRLVISTVLAVAVAPLQVAAQGSVRAAPTVATATVNGAQIGYRSFGSGEVAIVLLHGWPQSSREWDVVASELATQRRVIAVDLRGIGASSAPEKGYDKQTMAADVNALMRHLGIGPHYVMGHDIGGMVAYAYARQFPENLLGVGVFDVPLAGIDPWTQIKADARSWHFGFHQSPGLAEQVLAGRESIYFNDFYNRLSAKPGAITPERAALFASAYQTPAALKAGFEWYRAFDADEKFNTARTGPLKTPFLLLGGDKSMGPLLPMLADGLRKVGATDVRTTVLTGSGHWLAEEQPKQVIDAIRAFVVATQRP